MKTGFLSLNYRNVLAYIIIVFIIIVIGYCCYNKTTETMSNESNVVFIIPSSSRNMNFADADSCSLLKTLYSSLQKLDISNYKFIIGIDDDDEFYLKHINELKERLPKNFHFHFFNNFDKSYVCIVNQLAAVAINDYGAEYLSVFADDLNVYSLDHINKFIDYFKNNGYICLGWAIDEGNERIATHPFLHKKHVELLGYFYPKEIKNWYCDDWATEVYTKLGKIIKSDKPVFANTLLAQDANRYTIAPVENLQGLVDFAVDVLSQ
uniref:Glycosyltransferase 2-like domain-containing protein n=1 Tax=viral metagenome TaxID=1070528 RepID=A0A6C0B2T4_9ZZZZ